jgi:transcription initiation factor IIF auxiliary subunit
VLIGCTPSVETVKNTTNQTKLAKIALEAEDAEVRSAAVGKLTDQAFLAKIVLEGKDEDIRHTATEKLTDEFMLAKIALEAKDGDVRSGALRKLTYKAKNNDGVTAETYEKVTRSDNMDFSLLEKEKGSGLMGGRYFILDGVVTKFTLSGKTIPLETDKITEDCYIITKDFGMVKLTMNATGIEIWLTPTQKIVFKQFAELNTEKAQ